MEERRDSARARTWWEGRALYDTWRLWRSSWVPAIVRKSPWSLCGIAFGGYLSVNLKAECAHQATC